MDRNPNPMPTAGPTAPMNLLAKNIGDLEMRMRKFEANQQSIVTQMNEWAKSIDSIDQVAFISIYIQVVGSIEGKNKITKDGVKKAHELIAEAFQKLNDYRDVIMKEVEAEKSKEVKKKDGSKKNAKGSN